MTIYNFKFQIYGCNDMDLGSFDEEKRTLPSADDISPKRKRCDYSVTEEMIQRESDSKAIDFLKATDIISKLKNTDEDIQTCVQNIKKYGLHFNSLFMVV